MKTPLHRILSQAALLGLLLAAQPAAQAQWLVVDEEAIKQLEQANKKLQNIHDQIKISGTGVGAYSKSGQVSDNTSNFLSLSLPLNTNTLLDPGKLSTNTTQFENDAKTYFGVDTTPNCNTALAQTAPVLYDNCVRARNILGSQLAAIRTISQTLEGRNRKLEAMLQNDEYKTAGELQKKQYEISALQAMIANDQMRLQTALAAFNTTREIYLTKQGEALQARVGGKSDNNGDSVLGDTLKGIFGQIAGAAGGIQLGKAAADQAGNAFAPSGLFDKAYYTKVKARIDSAFKQ